MNRRKFLSVFCGIPVISVVGIPALPQDMVRPPIGTISLGTLRRAARSLLDAQDLPNFIPVWKYASLQPISSQEIGCFGVENRVLRIPES